MPIKNSKNRRRNRFLGSLTVCAARLSETCGQLDSLRRSSTDLFGFRHCPNYYYNHYSYNRNENKNHTRHWAYTYTCLLYAQ